MLHLVQRIYIYLSNYLLVCVGVYGIIVFSFDFKESMKLLITELN